MAATSEEKIAEKMRVAVSEKDMHKITNIVIGKFGLLRVCHLAFTQQMIDKYMVNGTPQADNMKPGNDTHLWMIKLEEEEQEFAGGEESVVHRESISMAYQTKVNLETHHDRVEFAHATMGSPPFERFEHAIKMGWVNIAGVTLEMVRKNRIKSEATAKGHLDQARSNFKSTKNKVDESEEGEEEEEKGVTPLNSVRCVIRSFKEWTDSGVISTDTTGKFPVESDDGENYFLVMVHKATGYIKLLAMKKKAEVSAKIQEGIKYFEEHGARVEIIYMDNEISADLRNFFKQKKIELNLVPPGNHRANPSERGVRTAKNHIIATLATADKQFPLKLWGKCKDQMEITLALTRKCPNNPNISTYEALYGHKYNFDAKPMVPIGTRVVIHDKSNERNTWGAHGRSGWYVGPALSHYRCFTVVPNSTGIPRVTDTVEFFPEILKLPGSSETEALTAVLQDLLKVLKRAKERGNSSRVSKVEESLFGIVEELRAIYSPMEDVKAMTQTSEGAEGQRQAEVRESREEMAISEGEKVNGIVETVFKEIENKKRRASKKKVETVVEKPSSMKDEQNETEENILKENLEKVEEEKPEQALYAKKMAKEGKNEESSGETEWALRAKFLDAEGKKMTMKKALKTNNAERFTELMVEEYRRLITTTDVMKPIPADGLPAGECTTYTSPQLTIDDNKNPKRVRLVVGGNNLEFGGDVSAKVASMEAKKTLLQFTVTEPGARFASMDIKDFYITKMHRLEKSVYIKTPIKDIPKETIAEYDLKKFERDGIVIFKVDGCMYGLKEAGLIAQKALLKVLNTNGYSEPDNMMIVKAKDPKDKTTAVVNVDDFGIMYTNEADARKMLKVLEDNGYIIKVDWEGKKYCGMNINHDRINRTLTIDAGNMAQDILERFGMTECKGADSPLKYIAPKYGQSKQYSEADQSTPLNEDEVKRLQQIIGCLIFLAFTVRYDIVTAVCIVSAMQGKPTKKVLEAAHHILRYLKKHPKRGITFYPTNYKFIVYSDASQGADSKARGRTGGFGYFERADNPDLPNGLIFVNSNIQAVIPDSIAEAEIIAVHDNAKSAIPVLQIAKVLGKPQFKTPIWSDNECAVRLANTSGTTKRLKHVERRFYWIQDQVARNIYDVMWKKNLKNYSDFFTKRVPNHEHNGYMNLFTVEIK